MTPNERILAAALILRDAVEEASGQVSRNTESEKTAA